MCKLARHTVGAIVAMTLLVLCIGYQFFQYSYIKSCVENWYGDDFVRYVGRCTDVSYDNGIHLFDRYTFGLFVDNEQFLTGQGWNFSFESGESYYIPTTLCREQIPFRNLEGKKVSICCLPPTALSHCNLIVSLDNEDTNLLNEVDSRSYLQDANQRKFLSTLYIFVPLTMIVVVVTGILIWLDIADFQQRKYKMRSKQEKVDRLRENGELHPKKQLQKKMEKAPKNR